MDIVQDWTNTSLLGQEGPGLVSTAYTILILIIPYVTHWYIWYLSLSRLIESFESTVIGLVEQNKFTRLVFTGESTSFIAERVRQDIY